MTEELKDSTSSMAPKEFYDMVRSKPAPETLDEAFLRCNRDTRRSILKEVKRGSHPFAVMMRMGITMPKIKQDAKGNLT